MGGGRGEDRLITGGDRGGAGGGSRGGGSSGGGSRHGAFGAFSASA